MKSEWKKFAPLGLYLAGAALLAFGALYIMEREMTLYVQISLGLVVIGLATFVLLDPRKTQESLTGRQARYGSNAMVMVIAFTGILTVVNYLVYQNPKDWDLTEDKSNTFSADTLNILEKLEEPVEVIGFYTAGSAQARDSAIELFNRYNTASGGNFNTKFVDPNFDLGLAQSYSISQDRTVIMKMGKKQETLTFVNEKEVTGALLKMLSGEVQVIYFLAGHGEIDPAAFGEESYSAVINAIKLKNYEVNTLNLLVDKEIPADADMLIIARPLFPISAEEIILIDEFMQDGGNMVILKDPVIQNLMAIESTATQEEEADPLDKYLVESWGIKLGQNIIVDRQSQNGLQVVAGAYALHHPITEKLEGIVSIYPMARSVEALDTSEEITRDVLVYSAGESVDGYITWAESNIDLLLESGEADVDDVEDIPGPVPFVVAAENNETESRLVVFGDADFAADLNFDQYANGRMLVNAIDWTSEQEGLINLEVRDKIQRFLPPVTQKSLIGLVLMAVCLIPGMLIGAGVWVYVGRRRRM